MTVLGRRGQPDLVAHHHGCRPAAIGDLGFPFDVVGLAPAKRKADRFPVTPGRDMPIAGGPPELGPIRAPRHSVKSQQNQPKQAQRPDSVPRLMPCRKRKTGACHGSWLQGDMGNAASQ